MLFNLGNDRERERAAIDALASYQVDGFILNTLGQGEGRRMWNTLHGKPAVLVTGATPGWRQTSSRWDNQGAMREACAHLQQQGWQRLLYITQPLLGVSSRIERTEAFRALVSSKRSAVRGTVLELAAEQGDEVLDQALTDLLRQARPGRALRGGGGQFGGHAAGGCSRLAQKGWTFGQQLGFVGFDDPEWASLIRPGLSAVAQPTDAIGQRAAQCLLERINGLEGPARESLLPGLLVVRGSSLGPAVAPDPG